MAQSNTVQLRESHGRHFNDRNEGYMLPADAPEHARLNVQHEMLRISLRGLYASPSLVKRTLVDRGDGARGPTVLDVGTGSGNWALDVALEFPHADVIGIDIVPPTVAQANKADLAVNCRFQIEDANDGLKGWTDAVDVLHARCISAGVKDFELLLYDVARCLKAQGVLLAATGILILYDEKHVPFPSREEGQPGFTWLQWFLDFVTNSHLRRGHTMTKHYLHWAEWLESNPNYQDIVTDEFWVALGSWGTGWNADETAAAEMMRTNFMELIESYRPMFIADGHDLAGLDRAIEEVRERKNRGYTRWLYHTAVRRDAPWQPRIGPAPRGSF